jgi:hypothetical protein
MEEGKISKEEMKGQGEKKGGNREEKDIRVVVMKEYEVK